MNPMNVLRMVKSMGGAPGRILIVGCEPAEIGSDEEGKLGLSEPVAAAVDEAVRHDRDAGFEARSEPREVLQSQ